jgi:hypothetical protein
MVTTIREGYDPKNRLVSLTQDGEKFFASKEQTGFKSVGLSKDDAEKMYDFLIEDSHNQ